MDTPGGNMGERMCMYHPRRGLDRPADGVGSGVVRWYIGNKNNILNDILVDAHDVIITYL